MKCADCPHRLPRFDGVFSEYVCKFTGAQVPPFINGGTFADDPEHLCPLTFGYAKRQALSDPIAGGILTQIEARGQLDELLSQYPADISLRMRQAFDIYQQVELQKLLVAAIR